MRLRAYQWCWLLASLSLILAVLSGVNHWGWGWVAAAAFYAGEMWREGWFALKAELLR